MIDGLKERLSRLTPEQLSKLSPDELLAIDEFLKQDQTEQLSGTFLEFCKAADPKFKHYPHVEYIGGFLQQVADGEIDRLMIICPPRSGKSYLSTRLFPAYFLYNNPDKFVMLTACTADLARNKFSVELRELMQKPPINLEMGPATSKDLWRTDCGGGVIAAGAGGTIIGLGADLLIVDDPFKSAQDAMSPATQNAIHSWWASTASARLEPGGKIIIINQRFSDNDLSGRIMEQNGDDWVILRLPAIAEEDDPMGRAPGEALCPDRYTIEDLERRRKDVGASVFECVYQGNPVPEGGSLFKRVDARYFSSPGDDSLLLDGRAYDTTNCPQFLSCDLAQSVTDRADFSVFAHILVTPDGDMCVLNMIRGRWKATDTESRIKQYMDRHKELQFLVIERSPGSIPTIEQLRKDFLVYDPPPRQAKTVRAVPLQILQERGKLWTANPDNEQWVTDLEHELYRFPLGRYDDMVDSLAWGTDYLDKIKVGDPQFMVTSTQMPSIAERIYGGDTTRPQSKLFPWMNE